MRSARVSPALPRPSTGWIEIDNPGIEDDAVEQSLHRLRRCIGNAETARAGSALELDLEPGGAVFEIVQGDRIGLSQDPDDRSAA